MVSKIQIDYNESSIFELIKGLKDFNTLVVEKDIQPNRLRNWKRKFINNAIVVFYAK